MASGYGQGAPGGYNNQARSAANRMQDSLPSKVHLELRCESLMNKDIGSLSDPFVVVYVSDAMTQSLQARAVGSKMTHTLSNKRIVDGYKELGRTEVIKNNLNPNFSKRVEVEYFFEERQDLLFAVYDQDSNSDVLELHDSLGIARTTLGEVVSASKEWKGALGLKKRGSSGLSGPITDSKKCGFVYAKAHEESETMLAVSLEAAGSELDKKDLFGKSDPFYVFKRTNGSSLYQSEYIKNTLHPTWKPMQLKVPLAVQDEQLILQVYDHDEMSRPDLIGEARVSIKQLTSRPTLPLINEKIREKKKKKYKDSGRFVVRSCVVQEVPTFLQYIRGGLQLNFSVGVDFTASNGPPDQPESLHFISPDPAARPNQYELALRAIGGVLQDYDSDRMFPALGFGGRLLDGSISFNFCLNGQPNPMCAGIDGVLHAYKQAVRVIKLAGPTNFTPLIRYFMDTTRHTRLTPQSQFYNVLLILTDGVITDMDETKEAIVEASQYPMSIIIVGIGTSAAAFKAMDVLDSDAVRLVAPSGKQAIRDIVQFVPFAQFEGLPPERLAAHLLQEVPANVVEYLNTICKIKPNPPR
mmetsp:Transcript_15399/g.33135  ORF Transcript_15399/g.33135 Transcript_15399/m.33135 type:complete len:582 (-) Transcript_15399:468-2213(-)